MSEMKRVKWTGELVNKFWNGVAQSRLSDMSFSFLAGAECIQVFSSFLDINCTYLDFGGGDGHLADLLCAKGYKVAIYDPSGDRTQAARQRLKRHETFLGVVDHTTDIRFDGVFLIEVAEHILDEDLGETYLMINRLLSDDGLLFLTTPNKEDLDLGMCYDPESGAYFHRWQHVRSFDRNSLSKLLKSFGLFEVLIHEIDFREEIFNSIKEMVADKNVPDPFATRRPVLLTSGANLAAIFAKHPSRIQIDPNPYFISYQIVTSTPEEIFADNNRVSSVYLSPHSVEHDSGKCYLCDLPQVCATDIVGSNNSVLRLYEDERPLGPAHSIHDDIRREGRGQYSHWHGNTLFFSSSDGSDPRSNGRAYRIVFPKSPV